VPDEVLVVGIAGGSGSGKTTVADRLAAALPGGRVRTLRYDAYYRDHPDLDLEAREGLNYDHPDALETPLLVQHLRALRRGEGVQTPVYNFTTHRRDDKTLAVGPAPVIVVEGILTFHDPSLRDELDIKIFVDTDADIRVIRRIRRDMEKRGRSFDSVRRQYYDTVRPMYEQFVAPSRRFADLIIPEGGENVVAIDLLVAKLRQFG
jgi:uridine kinase